MRRAGARATRGRAMRRRWDDGNVRDRAFAGGERGAARSEAARAGTFARRRGVAWGFRRRGRTRRRRRDGDVERRAGARGNGKTDCDL